MKSVNVFVLSDVSNILIRASYHTDMVDSSIRDISLDIASKSHMYIFCRYCDVSSCGEVYMYVCMCVYMCVCVYMYVCVFVCVWTAVHIDLVWSFCLFVNSSTTKHRTESSHWSGEMWLPRRVSWTFMWGKDSIYCYAVSSQVIWPCRDRHPLG